MPLPDPPPYVPSKTCVDRAVQVDVRGLFNFDYEVEPLLEVLVGKTLETAELEVAEEEEMSELEEKKTGLVVDSILACTAVLSPELKTDRNAPQQSPRAEAGREGSDRGDRAQGG